MSATVPDTRSAQEPKADLPPNELQSRLVDPFGRTITYIRISVTDRCNLRCRYCMPSQAPEWMERSSLLSFEEIERFVRVAASEGVRKIRITGGEPTVRKNLPELIQRIAVIPGIRDLSMTTNATMLAANAVALRDAGLNRLNISLDSLHPDRFEHITKANMFAQVWAGLQSALQVGFHPLKLNVVVIRGFNDDEIVDFARLTLDQPLHVRFIEYMPIGADTKDWSRDKVFPCAEMRERIQSQFQMDPLAESADATGPARDFQIHGAVGKLGFISPVSDEFCERCNRVRLTSDGKLRGCLMQDGEVDFREAFRAGATDQELRLLLHRAISQKPEKHLINSPDFKASSFYTMNRLGG